jgi:hypothetical protein
LDASGLKEEKELFVENDEVKDDEGVVVEEGYVVAEELGVKEEEKEELGWKEAGENDAGVKEAGANEEEKDVVVVEGVEAEGKELVAKELLVEREEGAKDPFGLISGNSVDDFVSELKVESPEDVRLEADRLEGEKPEGERVEGDRLEGFVKEDNETGETKDPNKFCCS